MLTHAVIDDVITLDDIGLTFSIRPSRRHFRHAAAFFTSFH